VSGHFEQGIWKEDPPIIQQYFSYPDSHFQLFTIIEKLARIERQLMGMQADISSIKMEMGWKR
jgi:hypothetical protein